MQWMDSLRERESEWQNGNVSAANTILTTIFTYPDDITINANAVVRSSFTT